VKKLKNVGTGGSVRINTSFGYGNIIRGFGFVGNMEGVWDTWREMRKRRVEMSSVTLGCMAESLSSNADPDGGYELIREVLDDPATKPLVNAVIFGSVLKGFSHQKRFDRVWAIYQELINAGLQLSIVTFNTLVDACARCGEMGYVQGLLEEMDTQGIPPNVITYSAIIKGYCQENHVGRALQLMQEMQSNKNLRPDEHTYNTVINGCARQGLYDKGMALLDEMMKLGVQPTNFTLSVLVKLASRSRKTQEAFELCEKLSKKYKFRLNVHVHNGLIQACVARSTSVDLNRGLRILSNMVADRVQPDARTYSLLLRACIQYRAVEDAAGLLRAAHGLPGAHKVLEGAPRQMFQIRGGLPKDIVKEVIDGLKHCSNEALAKQLSAEITGKRF